MDHIFYTNVNVFCVCICNIEDGGSCTCGVMYAQVSQKVVLLPV